VEWGTGRFPQRAPKAWSGETGRFPSGHCKLGRNGERVELSVDENGRWSASGGRLQAGLAGCVDVDISATPFTNTLPIRRLALEPGSSSEIDVLYVAVVPTLELTRVQQRYTCLEAGEHTGRYLYESPATGLRAELVVDGDGLVIDYPGVWDRPPAGPRRS
jgi:uncharacterized protein